MLLMKSAQAELAMNELAERIAAERKKAGYSLEGLSHLTGLSISTLSEIENKKSNPTMLSILKISYALELKLSGVLKSIEDTQAL